MPSVTVILGSVSDKAVFDKAKKVFEEFGVSYSVKIASAHRSPELVEKIINESDSDVFIAIAGLSAALPGVIASKTVKPVIGVPVESKLNGLDALLSVTQMPPGIPVASVGIDRGENAALLALQILALKDKTIAEKIGAYRKKMRIKIEEDNKEVEKW